MAPALMVAGAAVTAYGQYSQGQAAKASADMVAQQERMNAKSSMAEGIRAAHEIRRQGRMVKSGAQAAMAASGGVTDDVGAIKTMADIEQAYDFNSLAAMFAGATQSEAQKYAAEMSHYNGREAQRASRLATVGTLLSGASKAYSMGSTADPSVSGTAAIRNPGARFNGGNNSYG